jgi:hypothetical protein
MILPRMQETSSVAINCHRQLGKSQLNDAAGVLCIEVHRSHWIGFCLECPSHSTLRFHNVSLSILLLNLVTSPKPNISTRILYLQD